MDKSIKIFTRHELSAVIRSKYGAATKFASAHGFNKFRVNQHIQGIAWDEKIHQVIEKEFGIRREQMPSYELRLPVSAGPSGVAK